MCVLVDLFEDFVKEGILAMGGPGLLHSDTDVVALAQSKPDAVFHGVEVGGGSDPFGSGGDAGDGEDAAQWFAFFELTRSFAPVDCRLHDFTLVKSYYPDTIKIVNRSGCLSGFDAGDALFVIDHHLPNLLHRAENLGETGVHSLGEIRDISPG